ncbi:MAG: autotransporter assembly complex protein TamA [Alphaproteobacteria bacterium]
MRISYCFLVAICCGILSSCVTDIIGLSSDNSKQIEYKVTGIDDTDPIKTYIDAVIVSNISETSSDHDDSDFLHQSIRSDILKVVRSKGYYDAEVESTDDDLDTYNVTLGNATYINDIKITPNSYVNILSDLSISDGDPLDANAVFNAQSDIYNKIQADNCSFNLSVSHKVILDPDTRTADLTFYVDKGIKASFGDLSFTGDDSVRQDYLEQMVPWKEGDCFRRDLISSLRDKIMSTGLFKEVEVKLPEEAGEISTIPVEIELTEKAQRSIRAGVSYYTNEGPGAVLGWEHRNFLGAGEVFNADLTMSLREQSLKTKLLKSGFLRKNQSVVFKASLNREDTDAYENMEIETGVDVKRIMGKYLSAHIGGDLKITRINEEDEDTENYALFSPYSSILYDSRDSVLDPHSGMVFSASLHPFIDALGQSNPFVRAKVGVQSYYDISDNTTLAGRLSVGSILGADTDDVPATERFYAGGGGSIRGFGYQEVGPFEDGDPKGGRSLIEGSIETRFKISDNMGAVLFVDAGQVDDKVSPSFENLSVGAGVGFRYYTDFGPVRFDVGVPISGKENTDQNYQIYISIGQAF